MEILWYLEGHISGDLSLDAVAGATGISRFHASRAFALATGAFRCRTTHAHGV